MDNKKDYINPWAYDYSGDSGTGMINPPDFGGVDENEMNTAIQTAVDKLVNDAPAALDTLGEIAEALENGESIEAKLVAEIAKKLDTDTYEADKAMFATKDEIPTVPTKVSELVNDANFITEDALSDYAKSADVYTKDEADAKFLTEHQDLSAYVNGAIYNSDAKEIDFKHDENVLFVIDATPFIKDGMISSVAIDNGNLVITFNTDAGKEPITIPLTEIFNPANYYTKAETDTLFATKAEREDGDNAVKNAVFSKIWSKPNDVEHGWFQTKYTNADNSVAMLWNESDGGGALFENKTAGIKSFVGVNADGPDGVCAQIYSKNVSNNVGSRLNVNPNGIFYGVGGSATMMPEEELAVKGDIALAVDGLAKESDIPTKVSELENDANYITEHQSLEGYATETWVNEQGFLKKHQDLSTYVTGGDYNSQKKTIELKNGNTVLASIDATDFIKDGMVSEVKIENGNLVITFNSDSGKENIAIPLTDIFNPENYYTKTETNNKFVVGKITNQNGSYALIFNESDGGGSQYFNSTANVISYVGTNDGDANGICVQIYSKNKATNEGTRINVNPNGAYYGVGASTPLDPYNEIAVKGNISDLNTQIGKELAEKDATIAALNNELYNLRKIVGDIGGDVTYDLPGEGKSFDELMKNSGTVKLSEDVETSTYAGGITSKNKTTLNLNEKNLTFSGSTTNNPGIMTCGKQELTIMGKGTFDAAGRVAVNANGADTVINLSGKTGLFAAEPTYVTDRSGGELIYCYLGTINISAGIFKNNGADKTFLLNCYDANYKNGTAKIIVTGGKFYDFDPGNNTAEGPNTSFLEEGYHTEASTVTEEGVEHIVYTVKKDA